MTAGNNTTGRPTRLRLIESLAFAALFQLCVFLFLLAWTAFFVGQLSIKELLSLSAFAALSLPFVALLWFKVGSIYDQLSFFIMATIGVITAVIPCALVVFLTSGLELLVIAFILPGALPVAIAMTWLFDRARQWLIERYYAP